MKVTLVITVSVFCILSSGCTLSDNLLRTSVVQPILYSGYWDLKLEHHRFRKLAEGELEQARATARAESDNYACPPFSLDEEKGFVAGFIDYLSYGGTGNPPPLPPRRYWWSGCEGPLEYGAIQDWFKGFQHGAAVAQASGYRNCVTVPLSDGLLISTLPYYPGQFLDGQYAEGTETPLGEWDGSGDAEWSAPEAQPSGSAAEQIELPAPEEALPENWEAWLHNGQFPEVAASELNGEPTSAPDLRSGHSPPVVIAAAPPLDGAKRPAPSSTQSVESGLLELAPALLPPTGVEGFSEHADLLEAKRLPAIQPKGSEGVEALRPKALPTPTTSPADGQNKMGHPISKAALLQPRGSLVAAALLLVASALLLVRRPRVLVRCSNQHHRLPKDRERWDGEWHADGTPPTRTAPMRTAPTRTAPMGTAPAPRRHPRTAPRSQTLWFIALACCLLTGCSSLTNPVLNGIPVRKLPPELLSAPERDLLQTVPLSLLRQDQPEDYILAAGDVLGVFIAGVFPPTTADQPLVPPPVYFPSQIDPLGAGLPPSLGYPVTIRNDGTLALPLVDPISLDGLTVEQANERVRDAYATQGILQPGRESVLLTLMQPRQIRILIFRQEVGGFATGGRGDISSNGVKRGTGHIINLRAYENDVVNALANTGGLPGLDAYDGIYIFRGGQSNLELTQKLESLQSGADLSELSSLSVETDYIPTRWPPGEPMPFEKEDIILHEGDVLLLEARVEDLFYTAGLLPAGERVLPRDYDLDVVEAVVQVSGTLVNGAFGGNNFNGLLIQKGIGNPNPSALTVIRRTPNGGQIPIFVDLNRALVDPRERILVQAGDVLILQETRHESVARYFSDIFNFNVFWQVFQRGDASGAAAVTQLPNI